MGWENQKTWPLAPAEAVTDIPDSTNNHRDLKRILAVAPLTSCGCGQGRLPGVGIAMGSVCTERIFRWTLQESRPRSRNAWHKGEMKEVGQEPRTPKSGPAPTHAVFSARQFKVSALPLGAGRRGCFQLCFHSNSKKEQRHGDSHVLSQHSGH